MEVKAADAVKRNWISLNWKWFVPLGCFSLLILTALIAFVIVSSILNLVKSSDVYKEAIERARFNVEVIEALGAPLEEGFMFSGKIAIEGVSGEAVISIPIRGSKDRGVIHVRAFKESGKWNFDLLEVEISSSGEKINLLEESSYF